MKLAEFFVRFIVKTKMEQHNKASTFKCLGLQTIKPFKVHMYKKRANKNMTLQFYKDKTGVQFLLVLLPGYTMIHLWDSHCWLHVLDVSDIRQKYFYLWNGNRPCF